MDIITYPNEILLRKSEPVEITDEVREFCKELAMSQIGLWGTCVGLAAPQIGKNWRIFYAQGQLYINLEIIWMPRSGDIECIEGCYSLEEGKNYNVTRKYAIEIKWQDIDGKWHQKRFNGFLAEVIQHEFDHLEGKLCIHNEAERKQSLQTTV